MSRKFICCRLLSLTLFIALLEGLKEEENVILIFTSLHFIVRLHLFSCRDQKVRAEDSRDCHLVKETGATVFMFKHR